VPSGGHEPMAFFFSDTGSSTLGLGAINENFILFSAVPRFLFSIERFKCVIHEECWGLRTRKMMEGFVPTPGVKPVLNGFSLFSYRRTCP
jgi:hypothetical protein